MYGPGDDWTETVALALRRFPFFFPVPGDGRTRLQPLHVNDLRCILACLTNDKTSRKTYIVGGPQQMTYDELLNIIMQATRHTRRKRYLLPASAARWSNFMRGFIGGRTLYDPDTVGPVIHRSHHESRRGFVSVQLHARAHGRCAGLSALD